MGDGLGFGIGFDGRKMALPISHDIDNSWYMLLVSSILINFSCRLWEYVTIRKEKKIDNQEYLNR